MQKNLSSEKLNELKQVAHHARKNIIEMSFRAGYNCAHTGGSLSEVEIFTTLYHLVAKRESENVRDRVILSKAHGSLGQYCVLSSIGLIPEEELMTFEQNGSHYTAHAKKDLSKGLEFTGGSLGLGISYAVGVAYALKEKKSAEKVYVILGDGECDEGIVWEALMFANHHKLDNLTIIVDSNHLQADGFVEDVMNISPLKDKLTAFGFYSQVVDGHSIEALYHAFNNCQPGCPNAIIAETIKGKGVSFMENNYSWHFFVLTKAKYKKAMAELENIE